jgi:hypothetical protein
MLRPPPDQEEVEPLPPLNPESGRIIPGRMDCAPPPKNDGADMGAEIETALDVLQVDRFHLTRLLPVLTAKSIARNLE